MFFFFSIFLLHSLPAFSLIDTLLHKCISSYKHILLRPYMYTHHFVLTFRSLQCLFQLTEVGLRNKAKYFSFVFSKVNLTFFNLTGYSPRYTLFLLKYLVQHFCLANFCVPFSVEVNHQYIILNLLLHLIGSFYFILTYLQPSCAY